MTRSSVVATLGPYPGRVVLCATRRAFAAALKKYRAAETSQLPDVSADSSYGGYTACAPDSTYLVWAENPVYLVHELSHVVLNCFTYIRADPRECNGEPFCYLMQELYQQAMKLEWAGT